MLSQELVLGLVIILIIYVAFMLPVKQATIIIVGILMIAIYKNNKKEESFSNRYGNIKMTTDIDTLGQEPYLYKNTKSDKWDHSDVVSSVMDNVSNVYYNQNEVPRASFPAFYDFGGFLKRNNVSARSYNADQALARLQAYRANKNKQAITGAVRHTKNSYSKFFEDELNQNENRDWWDDNGTEYEWHPWV